MRLRLRAENPFRVSEESDEPEQEIVLDELALMDLKLEKPKKKKKDLNEPDDEELAWLDERRNITRVQDKLMMPRMKPDPLRHTTEMLLKRKAEARAGYREVFEGKRYVPPPKEEDPEEIA